MDSFSANDAAELGSVAPAAAPTDRRGVRSLRSSEAPAGADQRSRGGSDGTDGGVRAPHGQRGPADPRSDSVAHTRGLTGPAL